MLSCPIFTRGLKEKQLHLPSKCLFNTLGAYSWYLPAPVTSNTLSALCEDACQKG